jgi:hypothetical protein
MLIFALAACCTVLSPKIWAAAVEPGLQKVIAGDIVSVEGAVFARSDQTQATNSTARALKPGDSIYPQDVVNTSSDGRVKILMKDKSIVDLGPSSLFKVNHFDNKNGGTDRQVEVSLPYGSMRAAIAQKLTGAGKFKVRTPSATMGVRGTEFIVTSQLGDMKQLSQMLNHPSAAQLPLPARSPASSAGATSVTVLQGQVDMSHHDFDTRAQAGRNPSSSGQTSSGVVAITAGTQLSSAGLSSYNGKLGSAALQSNKPVQPVQMDASQLATISSTSHISDTTFQKAVSVDPVSTASSSGGSGALSASLAQAIVVATANIPPPPKINTGDIGIPGAFSTTQAFTQPQVNTQQLSHTVHVVIVPGQ